MSYDYNKVAMLLHVIDVSRNYPKLANITSAAMAELEEMANPKPKEEPKVVTPPAGPANAAVQNPDGTLAPVKPEAEKQAEASAQKAASDRAAAERPKEAQGNLLPEGQPQDEFQEVERRL